MPTLHAWISALRPRTLFLALATTLCGSGIALSVGKFSPVVAGLTMMTAIILQLLSNLANDLGDYQHGTDITGERIGPKRSVQSGTISPNQMRTGIYIAIACAVFSGLALIYQALKFLPLIIILSFLFLGILSILAAIKYTAGKNPYGYKGLGDIFSFVFFGPVAVAGTYFLHTHILDFRPWLPAIGMGLFTAAVLNINNMRDMENDEKSGKITLAIRLGLEKAKLYHSFLILGGIGCFILYNIRYAENAYAYFYLPVFILFLVILNKIVKTKDRKLLDPYLKYTSMSSFFLAVAFVLCINIKG